MKRMIYKTLLVSVLGILLSVSIRAQEVDYTFKQTTGFGYFDPMAAGEVGNLFFTKFVVKTNTRFFVGAGFATSLIFNELTEFIGNEGVRFYENYYLYNLYLEKHFVFGKKTNHLLSLGTGLVYEEIKYSEPRVYTTTNELGERVLVTEVSLSNSMQHNLGSLLEVNYSYSIKQVDFGVRLKSHILYDIGFSGFIVSPTIGVKF